MDELEFWSSDKRFGIRLHQEQVDHLIQLCTKAINQETGGIVVGYSVDRKFFKKGVESG